MKELKDANNILKNISLNNTYFENLMLGADQDGLVLNYSFRMNSFNYHIKPREDGLFEFSNEQQKESEMQIDKDVYIRHYSNKNSSNKQIGTLNEAIAHAAKAYSSSRIKSVKQFFEEEAEEFGNNQEALNGFINVFKEHFKEFLITNELRTLAIIGNDLKAAALRINDHATISINDKMDLISVNNDFDVVDALFDNSISHYIDEKTKNNLDLKYLSDINKKSKNQRKLH